MFLISRAASPVVALALALALANCGIAEEAAAGRTDLSAAQERVDKYTKKPTYEPPGEPFDARAAMAGKAIASVPVNSAIDFTQFYADAAERIAEEVGFTFTSWPNQGNPTEWGRGLEQAFSEDADLIELFAGIDPGQIAAQMARAEDQGVPVVAADTYDLTQEPDDTLAAAVPCPCSEAARVMADWVTVKTEGKGKFLVLTSSDVKASAASEEALKDEFADVCGECDVTYIDVPSADWATKILPQVQAALVADPEISYVLPVFDTMAIWVTQAITQANRRDQVKIATYNGTPSILDLMGESDLIEMNVGQSNDWMAHVTLDQEMRVIAGLEADPEATWPLYIWTKDNLDDAGSPASDSKGYGDEYQTGFRQLWGLS